MKKFLPLVCLLPGCLFAEEAASAPAGNYMQTILIIGLGIVFFYVILWRPEQKRRKAALTLRSSLKAGDKVTAMGIIGTVAKVQDSTVIVKMYDGAKIEFLKAAISEVQPQSDIQPDAKS